MPDVCHNDAEILLKLQFFILNIYPSIMFVVVPVCSLLFVLLCLCSFISFFLFMCSFIILDSYSSSWIIPHSRSFSLNSKQLLPLRVTTDPLKVQSGKKLQGTALVNSNFPLTFLLFFIIKKTAQRTWDLQFQKSGVLTYKTYCTISVVNHLTSTMLRL